MIKMVDILKETDKDKKLQMLEQRKHELLQRENRKDKIYKENKNEDL